MVKLVRLTSVNDATFKSNMDSEIKLGANAQVALHNLTFESDFAVLIVDQNNSVVTSQIESNFDETFSLLNNTTYQTSNHINFFRNLQNSLNASLSISKDSPDDGDTYASYNTTTRYDTTGAPILDEYKRIDYQTTPVSLPFHFNDKIKSFDTGDMNNTALRSNGHLPGNFGNRDLMYISENADGDAYTLELETNFGGRDELNTTVGSLNLISATSTNTRNCFVANAQPEYKFSNGTGIFGCYLKTLIDEAGAPSENCGFGMGLSFTDLSQLNPSVPSSYEKIIPDSARDFEIIVQKTTDFYSFMTPDTETPTVSTLVPHAFGGLINMLKAYTNDQLIIERSGGQIIGSIWNQTVAGGYRHELFNYALPNDATNLSLYPYIYIKGGSANCIVGRPYITFDSHFAGNEKQQYIGNVATLGGKNVADRPVAPGNWKTILELMDTPHGGPTNWSNLVPSISYERTQFLDIEETYRLTLSNDILRYMGFSKSQYNGPGYTTLTTQIAGDVGPLAWGWRITADNLFELINSDSYVVELLNIALESFDASVPVKNSDTNRGKRRNILDVIPINNATGVVEYAANEALYIDIKNAEPINITNLDIRVLNKNLQPIETVGMSVITVLFKD